MSTWITRLRARLRYRRFADDVAREIDLHRAMTQAALEADGMPPADARRHAARTLGNTTLMREDARRMWIGPWIDGLRQDVRYAVTGCRRRPLFTLGVVLMLALGIALATTVFTFASATFLRRWRVPDAASMVFIRPARPGRGISLPELRYLLTHTRTVSHVIASVRANVTIANDRDGDGGAIEAAYVTGNYFDVLRVGMAIGRGFAADEDDFSSPKAVAVISERLWRERFDRDPTVVGRTIRLDNRPFTIVGVTAPGYVDIHGSRYELWMPLGARSADRENREAFIDPRAPQPPIGVAGRLAAGATREEASAELTALSASFARGAGVPLISLAALDTRPIASGRIGTDFQITLMLLIALLVVQLLACANVGNLLLARGIARQRELSIRLAIGASRARVVRQLITEAAVLAVGAGLVGLGLSIAAPFILTRVVPEWPEHPEFYAPDLAVVSFALVLVTLTALAAGVAPAWRVVRRADAVAGLDRQTSDRRTRRLRGALLATQVAFATLLLLGASLLTRSIAHVFTIDPGFPLKGIQTIAADFPGGSQGPRRTAFFHALRDRVRQTGLPAIAFADNPPLVDRRVVMMVRRPDAPDGPTSIFASRAVSPGYFDVVGVRLIVGRAFSDDASRHELVVSQMTARQIWRGEDPVGASLLAGFGTALEPHTVVGVVADVPVRSLAEIEPVIYQATEYFAPTVLTRTLSPSVVAAVQAMGASIDPDVKLTARPLSDNFRESLGVAIAARSVGWAIGAIGLLLAIAGACGVFAFAVEERRREIGIRVALGARAAEILRLVLSSARTAVLLGVLVGSGLAAGGASLTRRFLYGLSPFDPIAYVQVAGVLIAAAVLATWMPARRALRVDPAVTLRSE